MNELTCKNCGGHDFKFKDDLIVCDYCHTIYQKEKEKPAELGKRNIFDYLSESQKEAQKAVENQPKWQMPAAIGLVVLMFVALIIILILQK